MAKNLAELFRETAEKFPGSPAFLYKNDKKEYLAVSYQDLYETGLNLAEALVDIGVKARENVALVADNRIEWIKADYGIILSGAADVPRGTDVTDDELVYILTHSGAKVAFLENDKVYNKFKKNKAKIKNVKTIIMMDPKSTAKGKDIFKMEDLVRKGKELRTKGGKKALKRIQGIKEGDLFTLIYTSGTTGQPKGVMLTHANMIHQVENLPQLVDVDNTDRTLSILPVWHIFERVFEYIFIKVGASTYYTNVRELRDDFPKARPTFMASAPRLWESIYQGIYNKLNDPKLTPPARKAIFTTAYFFSRHYNASLRFLKGLEVDITGRNHVVSLLMGIRSVIVLLLTGPFTLSLLSIMTGLMLNSPVSKFFFVVAGVGLVFNYKILDLIALSKIRQATGGKLKVSVSGGGALPAHVDAFFNDVGINVLEGYGLTETCPVVAVRTFRQLVMGSVGPIVPKTSVQIRDENGVVLTHVDDAGNILSGVPGKKGIVFVQGPQVMKGYFKNKQATDKVMKKGWFDTGDMGMINFKKTLTLTGRAKDTIVLLGGENVEPVPLENRLDESPLISQIMVIGQDKKTLGAIIVPDFKKLEDWCGQNGIKSVNHKELVKNPDVYNLYKSEVKSIVNTNTGFKSFEQVFNLILTDKPFEVGDELTAKFSLKRHVITEKYKKEIENVYK